MSERFFTCNLCEAQCGLRVAVEGSRVTGVRGDPDDVLSRGHVCPKAHALRELLDDPRGGFVSAICSLTSSASSHEAGWRACRSSLCDRRASRVVVLRESHALRVVKLRASQRFLDSPRSFGFVSSFLTIHRDQRVGLFSRFPMERRGYRGPSRARRPLGRCLSLASFAAAQNRKSFIFNHSLGSFMHFRSRDDAAPK